jgi:Mrp family chromosome partitioning ATPase
MDEKARWSMRTTKFRLSEPKAVFWFVYRVLLRSKDDAVIWREPLKHSVIKQFVGDWSGGPGLSHH